MVLESFEVVRGGGDGQREMERWKSLVYEYIKNWRYFLLGDIL